MSASTCCSTSRSATHQNKLDVFRSITEATSEALDVERVSIWRILPRSTGIACEDLFVRSSHSHEDGLVLLARDYPRYFHSLLESRTIPADDARTDPRTREFATSYLRAARHHVDDGRPDLAPGRAIWSCCATSI